MISAVVDYMPLSFLDFISHFIFLFFYKKTEIINRKKNTLYGSSCRSLFHTLIEYVCSVKPESTILVTPILHTSFRNIIELFFEPENITVLPMNEFYNKIIVTPEIASKKYDISVVAHLFGQDLDTSELDKLNYKDECLFIEDRVQGGEFTQKFSNPIFDMSLYSCGMDKKPCALGGGIVYSRNRGLDIILEMEKRIRTYRKETRADRFVFLAKKIPTYIIYNCKFVICLVLLFFRLAKIDLYKFICQYRKKNPGFMHDGYNIEPHYSTLHSIQYSLKNTDYIEKEQRYSGFVFSYLLENYKIRDCIPWKKEMVPLSIYNTIQVKDRDTFIKHLSYNNIPVIDNPTYKLFNFDYENKQKDIDFNTSLVYLPTLYKMPFWEIKELVEIIKTHNK
jgi:hypothetical protein